MKKIFALTLAMLLFALPASGAGWDRTADLTTESAGDGGVTSFPSEMNSVNSHMAYWTFTTDTDSESIDVRACENIDLFFWSDIDTDNNFPNSIRWYNCPTSNFAVAECENIENLLVNGDPAAGTFAIYGAAAAWLVGEIVWVSDIAVGAVKCNES